MSTPDATAARAPDARARRLLDSATSALALLTIIPVRARSGPDGLRTAAAWFPLVGALVGALAGATRFYTAGAFGPTVASVLALAVLVVVTGALHQDGLADCADGLGVRHDRERRLSVMRDPAIGAFGTLSLLGWGLLLVAALAQLSDSDAARALVVAAVVGRCAALIHAAGTRPARAQGLGAAFGVTPVSLIIASVTALVISVLVAGLTGGLGAAAAGVLVACTISAWARSTLGGRTGDTLGATIALAEVAVCLILLALPS